MSDENPVGRPTDFDPAFCPQVIEWGKEGKSRTWMASELGVARSTIYEWEKAHPEFSDALARAAAHCQKWWEDKGQVNLEKAGFQSSVWSRSMAARFPEDWREKTESTIQGPGGKAIQVSISSDDDRL